MNEDLKQAICDLFEIVESGDADKAEKIVVMGKKQQRVVVLNGKQDIIWISIEPEEERPKP